MKNLTKSFVILLFFSIVIFSSCDEAVKRRAEKLKSPIEGVWEMAEGKWVLSDSIVRITKTDTLHSIKIITGNSFSTVHWDCSRNGYGYNGGMYKYENGIYVEMLNYFNELDMIGISNYFKIEMGDDSFKMSSCDSLGNISNTGFFETWRRIQ